MTERRPTPSSRRALRAAADAAHRVPVRRAAARHARRAARIRGAVVLAVAAILVAGTVTAVTAALTAPVIVETADLAPDTGGDDLRAHVVPLPADGLPTPVMSGAKAQTGTALCDQPDLVTALSAGDDAAAIAAAGGAEAFRAAVAAGVAPCIPLDDPARSWVVANKLRPYVPVDAEPAELVAPTGVRSLEQSSLVPAAAASLTALVAGAAEAGAGELALASAYRSYATQRVTYDGHVRDRGVEGADLVSARPGHSEHQSGLAVDLVPCDATCATIDDLAASPQGEWLVAHAADYGWIVRYTEGHTDATGYAAEPWHLRYIGPDLARAYADGGWTSLEEFFGLPLAPDYAE